MSARRIHARPGHNKCAPHATYVILALAPMSSPNRPRHRAALMLGAATALALVVIAALALSGRGSRHPATLSGPAAPAVVGVTTKPAGGSRLLTRSRGAAGTLIADPEAAQSSPLPASAPTHAAAITPGQAALEATVSPGAPSDTEVKAQLRQMQTAQNAADTAAKPGAIGATGTVTPPKSGPAAIARVIAGANAIADFPYVFGGGHASFIDTAYDCSGSLSYALAAGGLVNQTMTSGELMTWGVPGPGRYLTVYANPGHTFMYLDGLRYDTSGRSGVFGTRWTTAPRSLGGFAVRHWPGL